VVQFVMSAPGGRPTVTLEDAMHIMYLRYGRQLLDSQARAARPPRTAARKSKQAQLWQGYQASCGLTHWHGSG